MNDLELAKEILTQQDCTCVLVRGASVLTSHDRGIAPLVVWIENGTDCRGFSAADKVVGKATAFLYARLGVSRVYARTMSTGAVDVLKQFGIPCTWDQQVDAILNRKQDGFCPMESTVREVSDPDEAWRLLCAKYHSMNP